MRTVFLLGAICAIAGTCAIYSANAASRYDGTWSVSLVTKQGGCDAGYSWNVAVTDGRIDNSSLFGQLAGFVDGNGNVSLKASNGSGMLLASGTIRGTGGSGTWLSYGNRCSGQWHATRAAS